MGVEQAYQAGGWPMVIIAGLVCILINRERKIDRLERRIDEIMGTSLTLLTEYQKRDQEELKEHRRLRDMETRR